MLNPLEFWADFLHQAQDMTNVTLVSEDGQQKNTHAVLLASVSKFLSSLLLEVSDVKDRTVILLPDFTMTEIEECLLSIMPGQPDGGRLGQTLLLDVKPKAMGEKEKITVDHTSKLLANSHNTELNKTIENSELETQKKSEIVPLATILNLIREKRAANVVYDNIGIKVCENKNILLKVEVTKQEFDESQVEDKEFVKSNLLAKKTKEDWVQYAEKVEDQYKCKICNDYVTKETNSKENRRNRSVKKISEHIYITHKIASKRKCPSCEDKFHYNWQLKKHMIKHTESQGEYYICPQCGKGLRNKQLLKMHELRKHSTEEEKLRLSKFSCSHCDKKFYIKSSLITHELRHGEKKLSCTQCDKSFCARPNLGIHFRNVHSDKKPKTEEKKAKLRAYMMKRCQKIKEANGGKSTEQERKWRRESARRRQGRLAKERERLAEEEERREMEKLDN